KRVDATTHNVEQRRDQSKPQKLHRCVSAMQVIVRPEQQHERGRNQQREELRLEAAQCLREQVVDKRQHRERCKTREIKCNATKTRHSSAMNTPAVERHVE